MDISFEAYRELTLRRPGSQGELPLEWRPAVTAHCLLIGEDRAERARHITSMLTELQHSGWNALCPSDVDDAAADIRVAYDLMVERYSRLEEQRDTDDEQTPLVLAVNDYIGLTGSMDLAAIIDCGRAVRVHLILGADRSLFADVLPTLRDGFVHTRIDAAPALAGASR